MPPADYDDQRCANCGERSTLNCTACKGAPNATEGVSSYTWYCEKECQQAHWDKHKIDCQNARVRRALFCAALTMQQIVYVFLKHSCMWNPGRIEKVGMDWLVHPGPYKGKSALMPFPYNLFPDVHDRRALLTYATCDVACSCMLEIIRSLFRGFFVEINEVTHTVVGFKHRITQLPSDQHLPFQCGGRPLHTVLKMTMENGEKYAVDFAGEQYGWRESIMPWVLYSSSRILEITEVGPLGYNRDQYKMYPRSMKDHEKWQYQTREELACYVQEAIMLWEMRGGLVANIFRLPHEENPGKITHLLSTIDEFLETKKQDQQSKGKYDVSFID